MLRRIVLGAFLLAGCEPDVPPPPSGGGSAPAPKGTIGLSVLTLTNPFFVEIAESMKVEAAKHGYSVDTVGGEFDAARQNNQVKDFIVRKVSAIVLTPCDSKAVGPAIREANAAGIPVFTADIACQDPEARVVCHVATDNYQGGRLAGGAMIEALGGTGKIVILDHPVVESVMQRTKGFREVLAGGKIEIVAVLPGGGAKDKGQAAAQDALQAHADLTGIFAINDPSALGAVAAVERAGKLDKIRIVGFDGAPEAKVAVRDGKLYATPTQFPRKIGAETVAAIAKHFAGEDVPKELLIPTSLYRKADADADPELKR
jgi:ribose transport system substrate-binding protein